TATWPSIRKALKPYWKSQGLPETPKFNLERGGEEKLTGNRLENSLAKAIGARWHADPDFQSRLRRDIHARLYEADYGQIGQRIVIRREAERQAKRTEARDSLKADFQLTDAEADTLARLTFPTGWERFSEAALWQFLTRLEAGAVFGALLAGPEEEEWRAATFPNRARPTGTSVDRLPTAKHNKAERDRQKAVRNPTVLRVQNELRKVVNNLIAVYGKPDRIRVEVARDVGKSARERDEDLARNRDREKERKTAAADLQSNGIAEPSRKDIEKWLLWQECRKQCPYTGREISFAALFHHGEFQVEHIWPRSRSLDDSFANKTLCHRDFNLTKANRTPFEALHHSPEEWAKALDRVRAFIGKRGRPNMKLRRFAATEIPADFAARQLTDTGYAARQAVGFLKMLFPDHGATSQVRVATLSGKVTDRLRRSWGLNKLLADDGEKTRADHRHHAIDALVAALAYPGYTQRLSRWFQAKDSPIPEPEPDLSPPFAGVREQAKRQLDQVVVSHRVRRKVSGPLHKDTTFGDGGQADTTYRWFLTRKKVETLSKDLLAKDDAWPDAHVRDRVREWVATNGGDPKKAFGTGYPTVSKDGPPIRKVRIRMKQQPSLMVKLKDGFADLGNNHHAAIYQTPDGETVFRVVSLMEAATRLRHGLPVVDRSPEGNLKFLMSLSAGDTVRLAGDRAGLWIVRTVSSKGQIALWPINDTDADKHETVFAPRIGGMIKRGLEKVSVDPIGRIRPARD
ncbi:MAG: type II CRISPR RNA-guided endonuclease Cas9, partial [Alphaproteobacteria bacterium]|nr:type II CRISPR RNA-guided endonuclease Cas9 [Alphaproteobacteria bacterium]